MRIKNSENKPSFARAILISSLFHAALLIIILVFPPLSLIKPRPPLDLMWVELPKGTGEDIYGLKDTKELPKTTIEQQEKALDAALKQPKEEAKEEPKQEKPAEAKAPEVKKEVSVSKTAMPAPGKAGAGKKRSGGSSMDKALAKIDKRLEDRRASPEAAQTGSSGEGYKYGTGDKPVRVPIDDPDYLKYQAMVRAKIIRQWVVPATITQIPSEKRPVVSIVVLISRSGDVISKQWARKSGMESLNTSAMRAIERASPFPVPPERLKWEAYNEGFLVEFRAQ